jgi:predicted RecA/RadA family phage recombinase
MSKVKSPFFFNIAKWISLAVATIALVGVVIALLYTLSTFSSGSFNTPRFNDDEVQEKVSLSLSENNVQSQQEKLEITTQYGQRILVIITKHGLKGDTVDTVIDGILRRIPKERRDDFINGWEKFLDEGMDYMRKNGRVNESTATQLSYLYSAQFGEALQKIKSDENEAKNGRLPAIGVAIALSLLFVVAMVVPVLVGIERNTRAFAAALAPAPIPAPAVNIPPAPVAAAAPAPQQPKAATVCPKCAAPIVAGDTFCGECGAHLS